LQAAKPNKIDINKNSLIIWFCLLTTRSLKPLHQITANVTALRILGYANCQIYFKN